jgi:hypothetical protein
MQAEFEKYSQNQLHIQNNLRNPLKIVACKASIHAASF